MSYRKVKDMLVDISYRKGKEGKTMLILDEGEVWVVREGYCPPGGVMVGNKLRLLGLDCDTGRDHPVLSLSTSADGRICKGYIVECWKGCGGIL